MFTESIMITTTIMNMIMTTTMATITITGIITMDR